MIQLPSRQLYSIVFSIVVFISFYLYIWLWINPALYYQNQEPVFFVESTFFKQFLQYPGGLMEYVSAFLSQFYYFPWIGALVVCLISYLICLATLGYIKKISKANPVRTIHLIPIIFLIILHSQYKHPLAVSVGLLVSLVFFNIYIRMAFRNIVLRIIFYLILAVVLHYVTAGPFLLFGLLCALYEFSMNGRWLLGLVMLIFSVLIPNAASNYFFMITTKQSFLHLLPLQQTYQPKWSPYLLYLYFPIILLAVIFLNRIVIPKQATQKVKRVSLVLKINDYFRTKLGHFAAYLTFIILAVVATLLSFDGQLKTVLRVDYYARHSKWEDILKIAKARPLEHVHIAFHTNRALYHTNRLPEDMFAFSQKWSDDGFMLPKEFGYLAPLSKSDIFFELGLLNEAQHWAYEALTLNGETPWNLQRLAVIHILKHQKQTAQKCITKLNKTLFFRDWAKRYQQFLDDDSLVLKDKQMQSIRLLSIDSDFIIRTSQPCLDLKSLLRRNSRNKMAFEYSMAYYLLNGELGKFMMNIECLGDFGYSHIPRVYEEALLLYITNTGRREIKLPGYRMSLDAINRFKNYQQILSQHGNDKVAAQNKLKEKYSDTYWFYLMYNKPKKSSGV